jgi:hypothetical protein
MLLKSVRVVGVPARELHFYLAINFFFLAYKNVRLQHFCINKCTIELYHLKENTMFTFETLVDTYEKNAKAALAYVQPEAVKTALIDLTDKQVEFSKSLAKQMESVADYINKNTKEVAAKFFPTK